MPLILPNSPAVEEVQYVDFVFIRHGETPWNVKIEREDVFGVKVNDSLIQGTTDIDLNEKGHVQAEEIAKKITTSGYQFKKIYTSPLKRAANTANAIAKETGIQPQNDQAFQACNWGVCEGRTNPYRQEHFFIDNKGNYRGKDWEKIPTLERWNIQAVPGSETTHSVMERMKKAMMAIASQSQEGEEVLIVTHQENMKAFKLFCQSELIEEARQNGDLESIEKLETSDFKNCSLHRVRFNLKNRTFSYLGEDQK